MKKIYDVCVIGGGASGSFCAIRCVENNLKTIIMDKNPIAKKILVTGNGRCNLGNSNITAEAYNSDFVKNIFEKFSMQKILFEFEKMGIFTYADLQGRFYPLSQTASSVVDAINFKLESLGVEYVSDFAQSCKKTRGIVDKTVQKSSTKHQKDGEKQEIFEILSQNGVKIYAKNVVCACGVKAAEEIFSNSKHNFLVQKPVLVGLECLKFDKKLAGVRWDCLVICKDFSEVGQVQFRQNGLSGIVIFNLSAKINEFPVKISLDLMPNFTHLEIQNMIKSIQKTAPYIKNYNILNGILPHKLGEYVIKQCSLDKDINFSTTDIEKIAEKIKNLSFTAINPSGVEQVLSGGFDLNEFNGLQSKIESGLFVCGEASGIYGVCGGFNLAYAFASGIVVAEEILNKNGIYH